VAKWSASRWAWSRVSYRKIIEEAERRGLLCPARSTLSDVLGASGRRIPKLETFRAIIAVLTDGADEQSWIHAWKRATEDQSVTQARLKEVGEAIKLFVLTTHPKHDVSLSRKIRQTWLASSKDQDLCMRMQLQPKADAAADVDRYWRDLAKFHLEGAGGRMPDYMTLFPTRSG
jgi:hypothetical protein